jgi:four helix bundle protein
LVSFDSLEDIEVWQDARKFSGRIYDLSESKSFSDDFSLKDQIRRAANSIALNIAEGYGLNSDQEFVRHLTIARGSVKEVKSALYLGFDQNYFDETTFHDLLAKTETLSKRITALIKHLAQ